MGDDDKWRSPEDEETETFEAPPAMLKRGQSGPRRAESAQTTPFEGRAKQLPESEEWQDRSISRGRVPEPLSDAESEKTMALDWAQTIRERVRESAEDPARDRADAGGDRGTRVSDESTMLLDLDRLRSGAAKLRATERDEASSDVALLNGRRARPFGWNRLERIAGDECRGLDELYEILPPDVGCTALTNEIAVYLSEVVGRPHSVALRKAGTALASGRAVEIDDGTWTWGRMPPGHERLVVGVQRHLAEGWVSALGSEVGVTGDDFEFGMVTYVVAEFCAAMCQNAGWPSWSWAVNPMGRRDLKTMLLIGESSRFELTFDVEFDAGRGSLRMWLPGALTRRIGAACERHREWDAKAATAWWGGLHVRRPLVAGATTLRRAEFVRMSVGDVVIVDRHGVEVAQAEDSAVEGGARWKVGDAQAVTGRLTDGGDGGWRFEVLSQQFATQKQEVDVSEQQQSQHGESVGVAVDAAQMELEVRIGAVEMALADLARLRAGQVIDCNRALGSPVELIVAGAQIGTGELVSVDGKLGVRILAMRRR